jgi:hypothetical protein
MGGRFVEARVCKIRVFALSDKKVPYGPPQLGLGGVANGVLPSQNPDKY